MDKTHLSIHQGKKIPVSVDLLFHVFGILVKQGKFSKVEAQLLWHYFFILNAVTGNSFVVRYWPILFVVVTWSVASLILTNYYTVLLISYVTAPNPESLITSIYELRGRPDIHLVTDKGRNTDTLLTVL